jgi:ABC-type antimicrobial peptide transport system permease subunit
MKRLLKPLLIGVACGAVTFPLSSWVIFSLLLRYHGFDQVPTDPDYHAAMAMGSWACFVQAAVCGIVVGLATIALVTRHLHRRKTIQVWFRGQNV